MDIVEILLILIVALVVLGPERLPEVMRTVGKVMRELRLASNTVMRELTDPLDERPAAMRPRPAIEPPRAEAVVAASAAPETKSEPPAKS